RLFRLSRFFGGTIPRGKPLGKRKALWGTLKLIRTYDTHVPSSYGVSFPDKECPSMICLFLPTYGMFFPALPPQLSHVHDVFHVSLLRGYKYHPLHVITYPLDQIRTDLSYAEEPEAIIDRQDRIMRKKTIPFVKILWRNHPEREATWETEESIRTSYPHFLP
nr:hypothetical protein [Tanacetum cinerariifolium]